MFNKIKNFFNLNALSTEEKVRDIIIVFLLFIWFINPGTKLFIIFFIVLLFSLAYITKKFDISVILVFFLSSFFLVGKTYFIQLSNLTQFPNLTQLYPIGLVTSVQISVNDVIFVFLVTYTIIMLRRKKIIFNKITFIDVSLMIFFLYGICSDIFVSNNVLLSLILKKELFEYISMYFFIRLIIKDHSLLFRLFISVILSLTLFEIFVALLQFIHSSPIGKTVEAIFDIESFGQGSDEIYFVFRPIGTFIHTNLYAMYLVTILPFFIYLIKKSKQYFPKLLLSLAIVCLTLTLSRSAWLAVIISFVTMTIYLRYHKKLLSIKSIPIKKIVLYTILIVPLFIYSVPRIIKISNIFQEGGGINLRINQTKEVGGLILRSPLFGTGRGMSVIKALEVYPEGVFVSFPSEIHNFYLLMTVENGIPYSGFFILFMFFSLKKLIDYKKTLPKISFISLMAMIIIGFFQPFFIYQFLFIIFALDYDKIS